MSFSDMIKNKVLEKFQAGNLMTMDIVMTLGLSIALGLFVYGFYRVNTKSGFYNRGFNQSLATMPVITAGIMLAMGSNLTISLGMVGALSIVRFRNAVKDPADLMYLFWSISLGIISGAGLFKLAILLSAAVAVLIAGLNLLPTFRAPCLLVISAADARIEKQIMQYAGICGRGARIRSRNVNRHGVEWIIEMQVRDEAALVEKTASIEGVESVHLMTHDGDVRF